MQQIELVNPYVPNKGSHLFSLVYDSKTKFPTYFSELAQLLDDPGVEVDVATTGPDAAAEVDLGPGSHFGKLRKFFDASSRQPKHRPICLAGNFHNTRHAQTDATSVRKLTHTAD